MKNQNTSTLKSSFLSGVIFACVCFSGQIQASPQSPQNVKKQAQALPQKQVDQSNFDPTKTWQYRTVERATPVVKGIRDCSAGALMGGFGGPASMVAGCGLAASGNSLLSVKQAY